MRSLGSRADGERLERMKASATWADERFHNVYPILPGLRDPAATMSSVASDACHADRCGR